MDDLFQRPLGPISITLNFSKKFLVKAEIPQLSSKKKLKKLIYTFGLPGYWINPVMARILLDKIEHLESLPLSLGRGFPEIKTRGIDAQLNLHYRNIGAQIVIPPLALALNNPLTSLTRTSPEQFGENSSSENV